MKDNQMTINPVPNSLTLSVKLGPDGVAQFQKFLSDQHEYHIDEESIFPGYEFVVGHWPPMDFWELEIQVGSVRMVIDDATIKLDRE